MALFSKKTTPAAKSAAKEVKKADDGRLALVLKSPWLSEKALIASEQGVYVFAIPAHATKHDVALAVEQVYKVKPRQVRVVNLPAKKVSLRTRRGEGSRARRHKAYVYLKKGETIQFA